METGDNKAVVYQFGKFVLDPNEKSLIADGVPMHLPAKEFDTLLLLVENNGRALSKEEMLSAIWHDTFVEESNLAKQISLLRKLLDSNGVSYIETLPKHGYRFSADLIRTIVEPDDSVVIEKRTVKRVTFDVEEETDTPPKQLPAAGKVKFYVEARRNYCLYCRLHRRILGYLDTTESERNYKNKFRCSFAFAVDQSRRGHKGAWPRPY